MLAIYKKELRQYFHSMVGFVFLAFFLAIISLLRLLRIVASLINKLLIILLEFLTKD